MINTCADSSGNNGSNFIGTSQLPIEILTKIFLSLDFSFLKYCPQVCIHWKNIVFHPHFNYAKRLLEKKYGKAGSDHLNYLINNKQLALRNVIRHVPIIKFLNSSTAMFSLRDIEYIENFENHVQLPVCFNKWLNIAFTLDNSTIYVDNLKEPNGITLKSEIENDEGFIRVSAIDDFVFGLCSNGKIIQWNFDSQNQIQIIETSLCTLCSKNIIPSIIFSSVGDNLFLSYFVQDRGVAITEIISSKLNSENSLIIESDEPLFVEAVEERQIYMTTSSGNLLIFDKKTNNFLDKNRQGNSVFISKEYIFHDDGNGGIQILDKSLRHLAWLPVPNNKGDRIRSSLFDYDQKYLIFFSRIVHQNVLSQYITIWHIESHEMIYHSICNNDSLQDIMAILESGQLNQAIWNLSGIIKDKAEDTERFLIHSVDDVGSFVKEKAEDCIIS